MIKHGSTIAQVESLFDIGLVDAPPKVVQFLPTGLKFLKPADLTVKFEKTLSDSECFTLHGFYNNIYQRIVWELVKNGIEEHNVEGVGHVKINNFCFFMFILARRGKLARILSHLNHSFTCRAYVLYRRLPSTDTMDISVVMLSEFLDEDKESDIRQLKYHIEAGFVVGEKGVLKRVHTHRRLKMWPYFPGINSTPFSFKVDQPQLDSVGFVIDHFKRIAVKSPAIGAVKISDIRRGDENESLWELNVCEMEERIQSEVVNGNLRFTVFSKYETLCIVGSYSIAMHCNTGRWGIIELPLVPQSDGVVNTFLISVLEQFTSPDPQHEGIFYALN